MIRGRDVGFEQYVSRFYSDSNSVTMHRFVDLISTFLAPSYMHRMFDLHTLNLAAVRSRNLQPRDAAPFNNVKGINKFDYRVKSESSHR